MMDEIENEYRAKNGLGQGKTVTSSTDNFLVRNWQDILAVYVYEESKKGVQSFLIDGACKDDLAEIFAMMNPVVRDESDSSRAAYANHHVDYYIKANKLSAEEEALIRKYVETDCKLLCATVTAAKGFVRESVGDDVSEDRVNVIAAAYSLVGKVGYFWGGKSTAIGTDSSWGSAATVTAEGSKSTGTLRAFGLDCSGFVTWAVINGYMDQSMQGTVGDGTSEQWTLANTVSESDAQPGDLVFQRGPEAGSDNHVGIICGQTDSGDWIAVHCSSSQNGVTVGEAYSASFRYIRQPDFYMSKADFLAIEDNKYQVDEYYGLEEETQDNDQEQELSENNTDPEESVEIIVSPDEPAQEESAEAVPADGEERPEGVTDAVDPENTDSEEIIAGEDASADEDRAPEQESSSDGVSEPGMNGDSEFIGEEEIPVIPIEGIGEETVQEEDSEPDSILAEEDAFIEEDSLDMTAIPVEAYEEVPEEDIESEEMSEDDIIEDYDETDPESSEEAETKTVKEGTDARKEEEFEIDPVIGKKIPKKKSAKKSKDDEAAQQETDFDESIFMDVDIIDPEDMESIRGVVKR